MKTVSLKMPDEVDAALTATALREGVSKSSYIRAAVVERLARTAEPSPGTFLDRAGDLIGCLEGPEDLSIAQEHMEGYGE